MPVKELTGSKCVKNWHDQHLARAHYTAYKVIALIICTNAQN